MDRDRWPLLLSRPVRRLPADLAAVVALVGLTCVTVLAPGVRQTPLRVVFGLPLVLFLPGYAFIAALFPEAGAGPAAEESVDEDASRSVPSRSERGIDGLERVALSFGTSIAIVPLIGLVLNFTPWGIRLVPVLFSISGFTVLAAAIGARRRWALPEDERFAVPYRRWIAQGRTELLEPETQADKVLNVLLVVSLLLATASVAYAVAVPKQGESFTELYLLTQNDSGELVADDYPTEFVRGEGRQLHVGIGNREHRRMEYTVVVKLQRVTFADNTTRAINASYTNGSSRLQGVTFANNTTRVLDERELDRFYASVGTNETWLGERTVEPTMTGERLRLIYLLYRGGAPPRPTAENAYREVHLWINVTEARG